MTTVVWSISGKIYEKKFDTFIDAMRFQGEMIKKHKRQLDYIEYKRVEEKA